MSAVPLALTVIVGRVPPPAVIGALHTLSSVLSDALKCVSSVYEFPAESLTADALALPPLKTPASTISRLPAVTFDVGCSARLLPTPRLETCCTNSGDWALVAGRGKSAITARAIPVTATTASAYRRRKGVGGLAPLVCGSAPVGAERPLINA
jgi:hypothetical protein